ncbi:hypothetical protein KP509_20G010000 [Ceratopteris richardii]|uniref:Protein CHAPERONE-LIKE PROTEIN OF POR1, chloroplastic n=1 Tax=Ceratopteris richardii TaxID=49495 RepID=A0A8T2SDK3_CERRI|nr:hypothetical protein KP509_20G010000 [Ceratopteris richardii]
MAALCVPSSPAVCNCSCCSAVSANGLRQASTSNATPSSYVPFRDMSLQKSSWVASSHVGSCRSDKVRSWKLRRLVSTPLLRVSANANADDSLPSEMSIETALKILGVSEGASFEEILRAKNAVLSKHNEDQEMAIQVEAAYDVLLMKSLVQRRAGKVVDSSVRYADVKKAKSSEMAGPQWLRDATKKFPVTVETPPPVTIGTQTAVYVGLMAWCFISGFSSGSTLNTNIEVPGPVLAIGFGASLYFLRKQNVKLGKAAAITLASLTTGAIVGGAVESWLRVDLIPVLGIGSPAVLISEFVLLSLWLSSLYLR